MLPLSTPLLNKLFPYSILQAITSPKPSSPPTLKSWLLYRWNRFKQRTDKWELLQWYLVILAIIACVLFSSLYQSRVMDLDLTNRYDMRIIFYDIHGIIEVPHCNMKFRSIGAELWSMIILQILKPLIFTYNLLHTTTSTLH